jgi:hypothetical protein
MKKILLITLALGGSIYLLFSYFFSDIQINKYSDIEAVKDQKAIKDGWIPSILPKSAYEIIETHDVDNHTLYGSFKYKEEDETLFMQHFSKSTENNNTLSWGDFLFKVDTSHNSVKFRNKIEEK